MTLRVFQSLWGMEALPFNSDQEWSVPDRFQQLLKHGFEGIDIAWTTGLPCAEAVAHAQALGVDFGLICFPSSPQAFHETAQLFTTFDPAPRYINVQPNTRAFTVDEGVRYVEACLAIADSLGLQPLVFETHRDRLTTDLRFTLQLLDAVPAMRLAADLSHFVVGEEFEWPITEEDHALIHRILERSDIFHGRIASREQVQIAFSWDYHQPWLDLFLGWWREGFRLWRERSAPNAELVFVPELGPPLWYAITGPDGKELSDRWQESILLQRHVRDIWEELERA